MIFKIVLYLVLVLYVDDFLPSFVLVVLVFVVTTEARAIRRRTESLERG